MKRHHVGKLEPVENKGIDAFLKEVVEVCKERGFSLSHGDTHGAFIVEKYERQHTVANGGPAW
jgi:hypothetical protein